MKHIPIIPATHLNKVVLETGQLLQHHFAAVESAEYCAPVTCAKVNRQIFSHMIFLFCSKNCSFKQCKHNICPIPFVTPFIVSCRLILYDNHCTTRISCNVSPFLNSNIASNLCQQFNRNYHGRLLHLSVIYLSLVCYSMRLIAGKNVVSNFTLDTKTHRE